MVDLDGKIDKVFDTLDDSIESREEAEASRTERLKIDTTSPFKLPHLIRPILAIWGAFTYTIAEIYLLYIGGITPLEVMAANSAIVMAIIGFYFNSRKAEKVISKQMAGQLQITKEKADAAIKIEAIKTRADIKEEKKEARHQRRGERRNRRR